MNNVEEIAAYRRQIDVKRRPFDAAFVKLFNASSDLVTISSLEDGTLLDVNDAFLRVTGYEHDEVIGQSLSGLGLWSPASEWAGLVPGAAKRSGPRP